ncbi:hypothetical protein Pla123a_37440 [Posidoniimonas polymericola]|uniref:Uncharacterized protein n=1 Tax=Posidoniimonas polymericola TaxID=2528002 RepID=A0A5C5YET3_9BACT|nr:hypothetical protein [Posidoniimonas polymericola]TWT73850.1 hypothetical protein Pla123a_37440 [Posidoniimonas polymericola]
MDRFPLYSLRAPLLVLPCLATLCGVVGCQNNQQAYRDIYLRELRLQEDEIYRLEDCIQEYQGIIRNYRAEAQQLKATTDSAGAVTPRPAPTAPRSLLDGAGTPADRRSPGLQRIDPPAADNLSEEEDSLFDVPSIDLGEPMAAPPGAAADPVEPPPLGVPAQDPPPLPQRSAPPAGAPPIDIPPLDEPLGGGDVAPLPDARYTPAEELPPLSQSRPEPNNPTAPIESEPDGAGPEFAAVLPTEPLGGLTVHGYAGPALDSGEPTLVTLIRLRTLLGEPTGFAGQASLMLIDPRVGEDGQKLARWDFSADEVAASWRADASQPVLDLAVVLPSGVPLDEELELWVRLVDEPNDQKLLDQTPVTLGRLASLDEATLAVAPPAEAAEPPTEDDKSGGWRASERANLVAVQQDAADSGWRQSDEPVEPRKIRLASHNEPSPLPLPGAAPAATPAAKAAAPAGGVMDWSPNR